MKIKVDTTYRRPDGLLQPTACPKLSKRGEIKWKKVRKADWHLKMFPNHYSGDFAVAWMYASLYNQGFEWTEE